MRRIALVFSAALAATALSGPAAHAAGHHLKNGLMVTIYSSANPQSFNPQQFINQQQNGGNGYFSSANVPGLGVVKEVRKMAIHAGLQRLNFTDVAQHIDPTSVSFTDLSNPHTQVLEQQFKFDLLNTDKLLQKYVNHKITIQNPLANGKFQDVTGKLLSDRDGSIVLRNASGLRVFNTQGLQFTLGKLPRGLMTKPTLQWLVHARTGGTHKILTTYQTSGLTWITDYNLILRKKHMGNLGAWVTLLNVSGTTYRHAKLKLIAGTINRVVQRPAYPMMMHAMVAAAYAPPQFKQKTFFQYHMYTLSRRITIRQNATQQVALFPTVQGIHVHQTLMYNGLSQHPYWYGQPNIDPNMNNTSSPNVSVYERFDNTHANKLGIPLPEGKLRVYKEDPADGTLEFLGEDLVHHTPAGEPVQVKVGTAFDVIGKRTRTAFHANFNGHTIDESFRVTLHNSRKKPVHVVVVQYMYRALNWKMTKHSVPYTKLDYRTVHFNVQVPAKGKTSITYSVHYSW